MPDRPEWNELDFLSWEAFRRMAPAVLGLEIARLERLMAAPLPALDVRNALVRSRFELQVLLRSLAETDRTAFVHTGLPHLEAAALNLPLAHPGLDPATRDTLTYVLDRLTYLHHRIRLLY